MLNVFVFLMALIAGLIISSMTGPSRRVLYVHPTPENTKDYLFRDKSGTCFKVVPAEVLCSKESLDYPVQV